MAFVEMVPAEEATGEIAAMYEAEAARRGYVPNYVRAFSARPAVYRAWGQLNGAIRANDVRRYELATLAAARRLRSSYCSLAHGKVLADQFFDTDTVRTLPDGLDAVDVAVMDLADKVAADATSITSADVDQLRQLGLSDAEIVDVVLAAAARCFFSKALDALGVQPDAVYAELEPGLREALTVGRPIEAAASAVQRP
ncbi:MAG TPA: peroxidase [Chloroflexota bacterium]|jgi:uncharacterized peroxidase-related enzyme